LTASRAPGTLTPGGYGEDTLHEYRDVTPISWGRRFHRQEFVSRGSLELIAERGGMP
jgi:hypothetical protein